MVIALLRSRAWKEADAVAAECRYPAFPLFFDLTDKPVLVVGAGTIASRRAGVLAEFGARLLVVAPDGCETMEKLARELPGRVRWLRRAYEESDLEGAALVLAATDDPAVNTSVAQECRRRGIPVNHAGDKAQSDFYFPGIARKGSLVVGVTASGSDHKLARRVTEELRGWLNERNDL